MSCSLWYILEQFLPTQKEQFPLRKEDQLSNFQVWVSSKENKEKFCFLLYFKKPLETKIYKLKHI